jgi:hypothetical protein
MAHYADLTSYEYSPGGERMLNIGWLAMGQPFRRGPVPLAFAHELGILARDPVDLTRGHHVCEFCKPPSDLIESSPKYEQVWEMFHSGNGEIHVRGASGTVYCAPSLILHYVAEHQYQPPQEFVEAVIFQRESRLHRDGRPGEVVTPTGP